MSESRCPLETLAGESGVHIGWCPDCGTFHLSMGFVRLKLTGQQFQHLHGLLNVALGQLSERQSGRNHQESVALRTQRKLH